MAIAEMHADLHDVVAITARSGAPALIEEARGHLVLGELTQSG